MRRIGGWGEGRGGREGKEGRGRREGKEGGGWEREMVL